MAESAIQWLTGSDGMLGRTWNPVPGCFKIGRGCKNCYAIGEAWRMAHNPNPKVASRYFNIVKKTRGGLNWTGNVRLDEDVLVQPLALKKSTKHFISLSDLFYFGRPNWHIDRVMQVIEEAYWHEFIILTKYIRSAERYFQLPASVRNLPNLTLGLSVSTQAEADELVPILLRTPAARRILSAEPLVEALDLTRIEHEPSGSGGTVYLNALKGTALSVGGSWNYSRLDCVIVGGESGHGAAPCDLTWISELIRQCADANVPCFVKQLGSDPRNGYEHVKLRDSKGGDWDEWPQALRVRQWPQVTLAAAA